MKTLLILRHAKSSWADAALSDHERPLNKRGRRNATEMGALLAAEDLVPEHIFCSTATRARRTAERAAEAAGYEGEIEFCQDLYHATPDAYLQRVATLEDGCEIVMVVGHNPTLEELVTETTGAYERFPTAALAVVQYDVPHWHEVINARGRLENLWRPRELE